MSWDNTRNEDLKVLDEARRSGHQHAAEQYEKVRSMAANSGLHNLREELINAHKYNDPRAAEKIESRIREYVGEHERE